ncbi:MAG: SH3 domain-containing protein [Parvularculaceae bacterium]|nr:SH3 domain-containing protein [Parvularculaceae bacterium]
MRISVFIAALSLCACSGGSGFDFGGGDNYAAASVLGAEISGSDARALELAFIQAVERGAPGERFDWRGPSAFGWVKARGRCIGNLKPDPLDCPEAPEGLALDETYETEQGLYALTGKANIRLGPSTNDPVRLQLPAGSPIVVVGKVVGKPWMLAENDGEIVGYIHESLLVKAPGTELDLAGGPRRRAAACRRYEQRISYRQRSDLWEGVACNESGRWVVQSAPADEPVKLY